MTKHYTNRILLPLNEEHYYILSNPLLLFAAFCVLYFIYYLFKQRRIYKRESQLVELFSDPHSDPVYDHVLSSMNLHIPRYRHSIQLMKSQSRHTPFTFGVLHAKIIMPDISYTPEERQFIYSHELYHIKHRDSLCKILGLVAIALHWYNPFTYLLYFKLGQMSEYACDESILKDASTQSRIFYGTLMIQMALIPAAPVTNRPGIGLSFFDAKSKLKKRIVMMTKTKTNKKLNRLLYPLIMLACFLTMALTIYAYEPVDQMFVEDSDASPALFAKADMIFISSDDIYTDVTLNSRKERYPNCPHYFVGGTLYIHNYDALYSCTTIAYAAKRCSNCGLILRERRIRSVRYFNCPHNDISLLAQ